MSIIIKKIKLLSSHKGCFLLFCLGFFFLSATAQNITTSPYSGYGFGELAPMQNASSLAMGGVSLAYNNKSNLNVYNPAALAKIDSMKFIFNIGFVGKYTMLNQGDKNDSFVDYNLARVGFGFKVSKRYSTAFSILPFSNIGYEMSEFKKVIGSTDYFTHQKKGSGGLNQLVWSNGFKITDNLSLGINGIYVFGNNKKEEVDILSSTFKATGELISSGLCFSLGTQYDLSFGNNDLTLAATYQPRIGVRAKFKAKSMVNGFVIDENEKSGSFDVPESYGFGLGLQRGKHLWFGMDYQFEKWADASFSDDAAKLFNSTKLFNNDNLFDRSKVSFGMEYNANDGYARKFLKKMTYRVGGFYDSGYIKIGDDKISTMGVSFGLGIPMARKKGMINMAVEFGTTGTTNNNLVREDFTRITIDVNLFERWFVKRKYH